MDKEKLAKIRERFPYVDMCLDKKSHAITVSVDTLYDLMFTNQVVCKKDPQLCIVLKRKMPKRLQN